MLSTSNPFFGFLISFGLNLFLNPILGIISLILLILHFVLGFPIWMFWVVFSAWILIHLIRTLILMIISSLMSPDLKTENKNPYSNYSYARKIGKSEKYKSKNHYDKSFSKPKESFKNPYSAGNKKQDDYRDFKE